MKGEFAHMEVGRRSLVVGESTLVQRDKIKIFTLYYRPGIEGDKIYELEKEVNKWLKEHPNVFVKAIGDTQVQVRDGIIQHAIRIWYTEAYVEHETQQD